MHYKYILSLLLICQFAVAQTNKHISIPGTKYSIVPPSGFELTSKFSGFYNAGTGASIMVSELPTSYRVLADSFTAETLKSRGMTLISKKAINFNGSEATFIEIEQLGNGVMYHKQLLMFGDSEKIALINGIYPKESNTDVSAIRKSLLSTLYNSEQSTDPLDAVEFTVQTEGTDFKLANNMSGTLLFSTDGKIPTDKPTLIVGSSMAKATGDDRRQFAVNRFKQLPDGSSASIKSTNEIVIDGLKGYEIVAEGNNDRGLKQLMYQVMVFNDSGDYYIIVGQATENLTQNLDIYRKIAKTFKRK